MIPDLRLGRPDTIGHVLQIGAGRGADLDQWRKLGAATVTLVEADPLHAAALRALEGPGVNVLLRAISADPERQCFYRANHAALSSLRVSTGLSELYPGIQIATKLDIEPLDPAELVAGIGVEPDVSNLLVLDAAGESLGILARLKSEGWLKHFSHILLKEGRSELYDGAGTLQDCTDILEADGYNLHIHDEADPDWPYLEAGFDHRLHHLQTELSEANAAHAALEAELKALQSEHAEMASHLTAVELRLAAATEMGRAAKEQRLVLEERLSAAQASAGEQVVKAEAARKTAEAQAQALEESLASAQSLAEAQRLAFEERLAAAETLRRSAEEKLIYSDRAAPPESETQTRQEDILDLARTMADAQMQALQNDLEHLQGQYAALQTEKDAQDALLAQVATHLKTLASGTSRSKSPARKRSSGAKSSRRSSGKGGKT